MNTLSLIYAGSLLVVGVINLMPLLGILGGGIIARSYGVSIESPEMELLLTHRALLFGIIGSFVLCSLAFPDLRIPAMIMAGVSMLGFLALAGRPADYSVEIVRVIRADWVGVAALALAASAATLKP